jgi:phosphoadenosine phosphosulfate reductase
MEIRIEEQKKKLCTMTIVEQIKEVARLFPGKVIFTTSFGIEDQVISHLIFTNNIPVEVATLDTGRLFPETYKVFSETIARYKKSINVYFPDHEDVESMMTLKGPNSFYQSQEDRHECCRVRKLVPLNRALKDMNVWISGIRAGQSDGRGNMDWFEYDENKKLFRFHPLFSWSFEAVEKYIKDNFIPYNLLHDKGYMSIGCAPCTRAVEKGEDFRSGRWWWESGSQKECGLHIK